MSNADHLGAWVLFGGVLFAFLWAAIRATWGRP